MIYAMKTRKHQSLEILLDLGQADPTYPANEGKIQTTAISEAMHHGNLDALELILKYRAKTLNNKSVIVTRKSGKPRMIRPLHYFLKIVRRCRIEMDDDYAKLFVNSSIKIKDKDERDTLVKFLIKISAFSP